jgi:hypothetical protein
MTAILVMWLCVLTRHADSALHSDGGFTKIAWAQVRVWDAETGVCTICHNFGRPIASLAFHAGGDYLAVASGHKVSLSIFFSALSPSHASCLHHMWRLVSFLALRLRHLPCHQAEAETFSASVRICPPKV